MACGFGNPRHSRLGSLRYFGCGCATEAWFMESFDFQDWTRIGAMNPFSFVAPVFQSARRAEWKVGVTGSTVHGEPPRLFDRASGP